MSYSIIQKTKWILVIFLITIYIIQIECQKSVSLKDFQHTLKIVHDVCQTKTKVKEELLEQVRKGNYVDDQMAKCYTHCFMEMLHLLSGTKGQFHVADRHTDYMIPQELFETTIKAFGHCEGITNDMTDNCEAGYAMLKCFTADNPDFWFN